jgi:serine/threonine protein kinase
LDTKEKTPAPSALPKKYGRYEVLKLIGEGAMGRVFLASDPVLKRQVAIKIVSVEKQLDEKIRREFLKRFSIEARLSAQLSHPSIVPVYDAGEEDGVPWIAFQYVSGVTLDKLIKSHGKLSVKWAVSIAVNIAAALQQAHKINVVHRDIKPSNIIIDRHGGVAKLTDFGVAKSPLASLTMEGNAMGSPGYMSPEQIEGRELDYRSDLFSLGVVLYEMLTGKHPFKRDSIQTTAYATISGKYTPAKLINKEIPARLDAIISQCLVPDLDKRISDASQLMDLLGTVASKAQSGEEGRRKLSSIKSGFLDLVKKGYTAALTALGSIKNRVKNRFARRFSEASSAPFQGQGDAVTGRDDKTSMTPVLTRIDTFKKKYSGFNDFLRKNLALARTVGIAVLSIAIALTTALLMGAYDDAGKASIWFPESGLTKSDLAVLEEFKTFFSDGDLDSANSRAVLLTLVENTAAIGQFLQGLVACRRQDFDDASAAFKTAESLPNGSTCIKRNRHYMVARYALVNERMPDMLVTILARQFGAADDRAVRKAIKDRSYWPRWNAYRILLAGGKKADKVHILILDLKYSEDRTIRAQAIHDLGDCADRRAIPALKEVRKFEKKDPYIASMAARVLKRVFKVK